MTALALLHICDNVNLVAVMLQGAPEKVDEATRHCMTVGGRRCISGAGCEILDGMPHGNFLAQSRTLREVG